MRLLFSASSYPTSATDWKSVFIARLLEALAASPELHICCWAPRGPTPTNVTRITDEADDRWLDDLLSRGGLAHQLRNHPAQGITSAFSFLRRLRKAIVRTRAPDILHFNWLQLALAAPSSSTPIVASVLGSDLQLLRLPGVPTLLRRALRDRPVALCPNATWMVDVLRQHFPPPIHVVPAPFGIEPQWFDITRAPNTGVDKWLVITRLTRRKLGPLFEWCTGHFGNGSRELHLIGPMQEQIDLPSWVRYHGPASPADLAAHWFPVAKGLITLSEHSEGRPQVMIEAMASGLPVIASSLPAHNDLLQHNVTGWICSDQNEFLRGVSHLSDKLTNEQTGERARRWAAETIGTWDRTAATYRTIYERLLAELRP